MSRRPIILSFIGLAFVAMPLCGYAQVSTADRNPGIQGEFVPSHKPVSAGDRLTGTVEYKLQNGNGKGESKGQSVDVQSPAYTENDVPAGANSRGVVRYGPPDLPVINNGQIMLKLLPGQKLPPTDIGNPIFKQSEEIYGSEGAPPPYAEFTRIDAKPSDLTFRQGILKDNKPWSDPTNIEVKPATFKSPATSGDTNGSESEK